jgi:hypothetical protein
MGMNGILDLRSGNGAGASQSGGHALIGRPPNVLPSGPGGSRQSGNAATLGYAGGMILDAHQRLRASNGMSVRQSGRVALITPSLNEQQSPSP